MELGTIGLLTEWQNLYVHRTIMVLGANEQANQTIANRASAVSERGLRRRGGKMAMKVISNVQKKTGIIFLILGLISILIYFILLLRYQTSNNDIRSFILITIVLLGFGISFIFISIYSGFTPQELTLHEDYILYKHWIQIRKISFNKIKKLRALGIKSENAKTWALVIESEDKLINAASDFDKQKLSEIFDKIAYFQDKFKFKIEIKD